MNKHIDIIRTNTDDMVVLAECNLLEKEIKELQKRIDKALELINDSTKATKMLLDDYMLDKEQNKMLIELLSDDIEHKRYLLNILKGDSNE